MISAIEKAADALRLHEQAGNKYDWHSISTAQRKRWMRKAQIVIDVYESERSQTSMRETGR